MEIDFEKLKLYSKADDSLRDYQQENKLKIYDVWSRNQSAMLQMPTGTGKTRLFVSIIKDIFQLSRDTKTALKVLILVHRTELIEQISDELSFSYGLAHGFIQSGDRERKKMPIQLASVQTLSRRLNNWTDKEFDFIIVDEAHHITADSYQKIIHAFPKAKLLGVTATPVRLNGEGYTDTFDELIISPSVRSFIDKGYLSQYEYYSVARSSFIQKEIDSIRKFKQGDYAESEMERVCDNDKIRAQVVKTYLDFAKGKKGIVYTINKLHNSNLCKEFNDCGVKAVAIDSDTPYNIREQYLEQFRRGEYDIICNVNLFTEGFDCPDIEFIQLARPTKSLALYLQQVGRGLRVAKNKEKTLFLDNVGLYNRFGFPSSNRMWKHHFEGKYFGNKTKEEVEGKKVVNPLDISKKEYHQNLDEGNEKIHLIQTSSEKMYLEQRTEQLKSWLKNLCAKQKEAYNKAYIDNFAQGLVMSSDSDDRLFCYQLKMEFPTKDLTKMLENTKFDCYEFHNGKKINEEYRLCKDYNELIEHINYKFYRDKIAIFNEKIKSLLEEYKTMNLTKEELVDIIPPMFEDEKESIITSRENDSQVHFLKALREFFLACVLNDETDSYNIIIDLIDIVSKQKGFKKII